MHTIFKKLTLFFIITNTLQAMDHATGNQTQKNPLKSCPRIIIIDPIDRFFALFQLRMQATSHVQNAVIAHNNSPTSNAFAWRWNETTQQLIGEEVISDDSQSAARTNAANAQPASTGSLESQPTPDKSCNATRNNKSPNHEKQAEYEQRQADPVKKQCIQEKSPRENKNGELTLAVLQATHDSLKKKPRKRRYI